MSITDIARVLRWNLTRAQQALERLTRRLLTTGHAIRCVHRERYELAARGNIVRPPELARMRRQESIISTDDAHLLLRLITGRDRDRLWEDLDTDPRAGVARLAGHDLVQPTGSCWVSLSYEAQFNLQPDLNRTASNGRYAARAQPTPTDHPDDSRCHAVLAATAIACSLLLPNRARSTAIEVTFHMLHRPTASSSVLAVLDNGGYGNPIARGRKLTVRPPGWVGKTRMDKQVDRGFRAGGAADQSPPHSPTEPPATERRRSDRHRSGR